MNEEELFCKLFPEYVVNGKPLSPYFDLFERGYEEAEEKLKCCGNCKHFKFVGESLKGNYQCLKDGDMGKYYRSCINFEKWEI
jgi:hypothetical protein